MSTSTICGHFKFYRSFWGPDWGRKGFRGRNNFQALLCWFGVFICFGLLWCLSLITTFNVDGQPGSAPSSSCTLTGQVAAGILWWRVPKLYLLYGMNVSREGCPLKIRRSTPFSQGASCLGARPCPQRHIQIEVKSILQRHQASSLLFLVFGGFLWTHLGIYVGHCRPWAILTLPHQPTCSSRFFVWQESLH